MENGKNGKTKIWVYAVILFTSAFIVLLFTAISQIRMNQSLDDYKNQLSSKDTENYQFRFNLNSALEENKKLLTEKDELKKRITQLEEEILSFQNKLKEADTYTASQKEAYELLLKAETEFEKGEYISSASILKNQVNVEMLGPFATESYNVLCEKVFGKASLMLYREGLKRFEEKAYPEAYNLFSLSLDYADGEYFSDDSAYYRMLSAYRQGKKEEAKNLLEDFLEKYPQSSYQKNVRNLLESIEKDKG